MLNLLDDCRRRFTGSKIYERERLLSYFASEQITEIQTANPQIDALRAHRNTQEIHRERRQTPQRAWEQARKEKRSALRPAPRCPWWDYVWSVRTVIKVGSDGRVPIGTQRLRIEKSPANQVVLCLHPDGHHSVLAAQPDPKQKPTLLFTNQHSCFENYATGREQKFASTRVRGQNAHRSTNQTSNRREMLRLTAQSRPLPAPR